MTTPDGWIWAAPVQCWPASTAQYPRPPFQCGPVGYTTVKLGADKGVGTLQLLTGLPRTRRGTVLRTCENPRVLSLRELLLLPLPPSPLLSLGLGALQIASISLMEANFPHLPGDMSWSHQPRTSQTRRGFSEYTQLPREFCKTKITWARKLRSFCLCLAQILIRFKTDQNTRRISWKPDCVRRL